MTSEEVKALPEAKINAQAADLFNSVCSLTDLSDLDKAVVCEAIHRIQDMMLGRIVTKIYGKL